jgi:monolysocardiolipin acyltransferase
MSGLLSTPTVVAVSLICKAFMNSPFCSVTVNGLPILLDALHSDQRRSGRGIVTGENITLYLSLSFAVTGEI